MSRNSKKTKPPKGRVTSGSPGKQPAAKQYLTPEQQAQIIKDRLANRPVITFRYPNGRLKKRLIISLALMLAALVAALVFLSRY